MADYIDDTKIRVQFEDDTRKGARSVEQSSRRMSKRVQKETEKVGKATQTFVGQRAGKAMSQFNEKTEKGRQLLNTFGGAMGGVGGEAVYYSGTLSYVVGMFSKLEMGIMGAIAAIGAFGYAVYDSVVGPINDATEAMEKQNKAAQDMIETTRDYVQGLVDERAGVTESAKKQRELRAEIVEQQMQMQKLVKVIEDAAKKPPQERGLAVIFGDLGSANEELYESHVRTLQLRALIQDLQREQQIAARNQSMSVLGEFVGSAVRILEESQQTIAKAQKRAAKEWRSQFSMGPSKMDAQVDAYRDHLTELEEAKRRHNERMIQLEFQLDRQIWTRQLENERRRQHFADQAVRIEQQRLERERQIEENRREMLDASLQAAQYGADIMSEVAGAVIKSESARMRIEAIYQAITDGLKAAHHTAEAVGAFASYRYAQGAMHAMAATLYTVSATLAAAKAGGAVSVPSGGGAGGAIASRGGGTGDMFRGREDEGREETRQTTIIIEGPVGDRETAEWVYNRFQSAMDRRDPGRTRSEVG
jgi:hypothetical protein